MTEQIAALDDEIARTYGAIHAPDNLTEILAKHGWAKTSEIRQQVAQEIVAKLAERRSEITPGRPGWGYLTEAIDMTNEIGGGA